MFKSFTRDLIYCFIKLISYCVILFIFAIPFIIYFGADHHIGMLILLTPPLWFTGIKALMFLEESILIMDKTLLRRVKRNLERNGFEYKADIYETIDKNGHLNNEQDWEVKNG